MPGLLGLRASPRLLAILLALHGAVAVAFTTVVTPPLSIAAVLLIALMSLRACRRVLDTAAHEFVLGACLSVRGRPDATDEWPVTASHDLGWALWLCWVGAGGRKHHLLLLADSLQQARHWRLLKAWARHRLLPAG